MYFEPKLIKHVGSAAFRYRQMVLKPAELKWRFIPHLRLYLIVKGCGYLFIGDNIVHYREGDLFLVGPKTLHRLRNIRLTDPLHVIAINFGRMFPCKEFFHLSEMHSVVNLFKRSSRGIKFFPPACGLVAEKIMSIPKQNGLQRILGVLEILYLLANSNHYKLIAKACSSQSVSQHHIVRMKKVIRFLGRNFRKDITQLDVANNVSMTSASFSHFFKNVMNKTFSDFLNRLRIAEACCLLFEDELKIGEICYQCGFNNLSHFNSQFRKIKGVSPREFQRQDGLSQ